MAKRLRGRVQERSREAVAKAGTRIPGSPVKTAGTWREQGGKLADGPFRPGKTAAERRRGRIA